MGVAAHLEGLSATDANVQLGKMQTAGIHWVRLEFSINSVYTAPSTYNFTAYDTLITSIQSHGMQIIGLLTQYNVPSWYNGSAPANQPMSAADFATYAHGIAVHYAGKIPLYEVGNEPNGSGFWYPTPSASAYSAMLKAAYPAIKSGDSNAKVISAGIDPVDAPESYLTQMYANGVHGYMDFVGYHPYCWPASPDYTNNPPSFSELANFRSIMQANGDGNKHIIVTEFGWPTYPSGGVTEALQAAYTQRVYQKILYEDYQYVDIACVYDFVNDGTDNTNAENNFGILHADLTTKPAYYSYQGMAAEYAANFTPVQP